jgi:nonsense-mediated mRNA decay protein 3
MTASAFCPSCGAEVDPDAHAGRGGPESAGSRRERSLCDSCYFDRYDLVDAPERVAVRVCATCGAVHRGNRWVDVGARDYTDVAVDAVRESLAVHADAEDVEWVVEPEQVDATTIRMHCYFSGTVRGTRLEEEVVVPVKISKGTCTRCGRIAGDYYASVVQVRAADRTPTAAETDRAREIAADVVAEMEATGDRSAFVTDVSETPDGLDIKVSTNKIGKKVASKLVEEFGGQWTDSETLVTEDEDGNEVYRVTYAVRLPPFTPGDVIDLADDDRTPVLVRSVQGNLKGVYLDTGERYEAEYEVGDAPDARKLGTVEDAEETTVVTVEDERSVQVLDPETFEAKTIPRPEFVDADARTVRVLKSRAGLHVVPDE